MLAQLFILKPGKLTHERLGGLKDMPLQVAWAKSHPQALPYVTDLSGNTLYVNPDSAASALQVLLTNQISVPVPRTKRIRTAKRFPVVEGAVEPVPGADSVKACQSPSSASRSPAASGTPSRPARAPPGTFSTPTAVKPG